MPVPPLPSAQAGKGPNVAWQLSVASDLLLHGACTRWLQGGRAQNPILREDELLQKLKPRRNKPKADAEGNLDPFAPEYSQDTWHAANGAGQAALASTKGAAYLLKGWKNNPNERKPVASNRRRK